MFIQVEAEMLVEPTGEDFEVKEEDVAAGEEVLTDDLTLPVTTVELRDTGLLIVARGRKLKMIQGSQRLTTTAISKTLDTHPCLQSVSQPDEISTGTPTQVPPTT